jgi:hypothetical protein
MSRFWGDPMLEWLRKKALIPVAPPADAPTEALTPMEAYAQEFVRAYNRSRRLGLRLPRVQLLARKDCLDMDRIQPVLQDYVGRYSQAEIIGQAFAINVQLVSLLADKIGLPLTLTMGWFDHAGKQPYQHDEAFIEKLLQEGAGKYLTERLPLHVWLTSPACEVLDVTLPTTLAEVTGSRNLAGGVVYLSNRTVAPGIIYHPTVVGGDFLMKIGVAV